MADKYLDALVALIEKERQRQREERAKAYEAACLAQFNARMKKLSKENQ